MDQNRNGFIAIVSLVGLVLAAPALAAPYTFDSNNLGWSHADITQPASSETVTMYQGGASWATEPGNGYIQMTSTTSSTPRAYNLGIFGSAGFLGDLTGQRMSADFRRSGVFETLAGTAPTVRMVISDATPGTSAYGQATWYYSSVLTAPTLNDIGASWATYLYDLESSDFFLWPNGSTGLAGQPSVVEFDQMLQSYSFVGFTILSSAGDGSGYGYNGNWDLPDYGARATAGMSEFHVDNIAVVPEPGTLALLGAATAGLLLSRRRRNG